ncbi:hypothetical protein J2P12_08225, partial [Candidatus Bathyarchaeota archaeon]|nr:hypothetical protein [Candidatus Bathyarchaeota archaeon]
RVATIIPSNGSGPKYGTLIEYNLPTHSTVCSTNCDPLVWWMRPGPNNLIWFVSYGMGEIGYVNATVPIPFSIDLSSQVTVVQGKSVNIPVSTSFIGEAPLINMSITRIDSTANPPMLSWTIGAERISSGGNTANSTIMLSAAWNSTLGPRYVAVTAYTANVALNTFVEVSVDPFSLTVYTTVGVAVGISAFSLISVGMTLVSTYRKRKK